MARRADATVAFLGRLDEPRKGCAVLAEACRRRAADRPGLRLLVVGGGDIDERARRCCRPGCRDQVTFLGRASDEDKAAALRTADVYVAPNTGGESFGIVLVEAMAAGATVLASDMPAFRRVLDDGAYGVLFPNRDAADLAARAGGLLDDPERRARAGRGRAGLRVRASTGTVVDDVIAVYETVSRACRSRGPARRSSWASRAACGRRELMARPGVSSSWCWSSASG